MARATTPVKLPPTAEQERRRRVRRLRRLSARPRDEAVDTRPPAWAWAALAAGLVLALVGLVADYGAAWVTFVLGLALVVLAVWQLTARRLRS